MYVSALPAGHWRTAVAASTEGAALAGLQRYAEAETLLVDSFAALNNDANAIPSFVELTGKRLVLLYEIWGKPEKAAEVLAMAKE